MSQIQTKILYESMPIGRIGVRRSDDEVVIASDFSCFAYMIDEYVSRGVLDILIPESYIEASKLDEMPSLLKKRVKIIDNSAELTATYRLLFGLRRALEVELPEGSHELVFPSGFPYDLKRDVRKIHADVLRLATGFNHNIQVEIDIESSVETLRNIRAKLSEHSDRSILAQIEGIFSHYEPVKFASHSMGEQAPADLVSIFDHLVNDPDYLAFSDSIARLSSPETRENALVKLREFSRIAASKKIFSSGWDYVTKILKVWPGVPLPESKDLSGIFKGKSFPSIVDMKDARNRAVDTWRSAGGASRPLMRESSRLATSDIYWLPALNSMRPGRVGEDATLGTVGELKEALERLRPPKI